MKIKLSKFFIITMSLALLRLDLVWAADIAQGPPAEKYLENRSAIILRWYLYESKEDGFSILMPKMPKVEETIIKERIGPKGSSGSGMVRIFTADVGSPSWEEKTFSVARVRFIKDIFLKGSSDKILNLQRDGFLSKVAKAQLISERSINHGEYPGKEILFSGEEARNYVFLEYFLFIKNTKYLVW